MSEYVKKELISWVKLIIIAGVISGVVYFFGFNFMTVQGQSMQPTLHDGDRMLVNRAALLFFEPDVSDIVILKEPEFTAWSDPYLVKRVIAVPGDTIEIRSGTLYRNGKKVSEPYTDSLVEDGDFGPDKVRNGNVFVMGDNRHIGSSKDSRYFGQVPVSLIVGRADLLVWPFDKVGVLD